MQYLCSTYGSSGDVFPMLGLALELKSRGHDVTFATNDHFGRIVREAGLPFEPLGTEADFVNCVANPQLWHPRKAFGHIFDFLKPTLARHYELHTQHAKHPNAMAITNCFGLGALLAQETHGLPVITVHLQPALMWSRLSPPTLPGLVGPRWLKNWLYQLGQRYFIDPLVCPFFNAWRHELGLQPIKNIMDYWNSPTGVLGLFPDWYAPIAADWPSQVKLTDFPLWNHQSQLAIPSPVNDFLARGEPPVVFTPGSANLHGKQFFQAALGACEMLRCRAIFLTQFAEQIPSDLPETVHYAPYVPLDLLLPHALAFVHHGGIGSASQAMLAGTPQIIMPLAHDQFDNAARIRRLGIGDSLPVSRFTAARLAKRLQRLLASTRCRQNCQSLAPRLHPSRGLSLAANYAETKISSTKIN